MEPRDRKLPTPGDLKYKWNQDGRGSSTQLTDKYWFIQRVGDGSLSDYVQLNTNVNWRFINLNHSFRSVLGPSSRSLHMYSDVGSSSVVGNQVTDLLREVDYKREGKGSYYFEPTHPQYIGVRKDVIDIIETQVSETDGKLVDFGNATRSFSFKTFNVSSIKQLIRGEEYPYETLELQHDGTSKDQRGYFRFLQATGCLCRGKGNMVLKENWGHDKKCTLFVFDNTANGCLDSPVLNPKQSGEVRLVIDFGANPGENLTILLYGEFENLLEINGNRVVTYDVYQ